MSVPASCLATKPQTAHISFSVRNQQTLSVSMSTTSFQALFLMFLVVSHWEIKLVLKKSLKKPLMARKTLTTSFGPFFWGRDGGRRQWLDSRGWWWLKKCLFVWISHEIAVNKITWWFWTLNELREDISFSTTTFIDIWMNSKCFFLFLLFLFNWFSFISFYVAYWHF
jgi:hypothetical protein